MSDWEDSVKAAIQELRVFKAGSINYFELDRQLAGNPLCDDAVDFATEAGGDPVSFDEYLSFLESMPTEEAYNAWLGECEAWMDS